MDRNNGYGESNITKVAMYVFSALLIGSGGQSHAADDEPSGPYTVLEVKAPEGVSYRLIRHSEIEKAGEKIAERNKARSQWYEMEKADAQKEGLREWRGKKPKAAKWKAVYRDNDESKAQAKMQSLIDKDKKKIEKKLKKCITQAFTGEDILVDALIQPVKSKEKFGKVPRQNAITKGMRNAAFLMRILAPVKSWPKSSKIVKAYLEFYVWDPSGVNVKTRVGIFRVASRNWDENNVCWSEPMPGIKWRGEFEFKVGRDTPPEDFTDAEVLIKPEPKVDTVEDAPHKYRVDITRLVQSWAKKEFPNFGLAIVPISDRSVDEGNHTRFQIYAGEFKTPEYRPKILIYAKK